MTEANGQTPNQEKLAIAGSLPKTIRFVEPVFVGKLKLLQHSDDARLGC